MFIQDILFNSNELLSMSVLPFKAPTKEPMELAVISSFLSPNASRGIELGNFRSHSAMDPHVIDFADQATLYSNSIVF